MGFFENLGIDYPVSRELAKIVRTISSDHRIKSDLDFYVTALNNINAVEGWQISSEVMFNAPFIVEPTSDVRIRVALFNELHINVLSPAANAVVKQYEDKIKLYLNESHTMLENKQIHGYFAAVITKSKKSKQYKTLSYYPKKDKFKYYYRAEPHGRSFRIVGETPHGL